MNEKQHTDTTSNEDARIQKTICELLHDDPKTDATKMEVEVNEGNVLLKGKADTEEEKTHAGQIAAGVPGVKKVENHLHIDIGITHALASFVARLIEGDEKHDKPPGKEEAD
ncbi:MAG: BON domain-containing protein [Chitinophagaceae bacterium]